MSLSLFFCCCYLHPSQAWGGGEPPFAGVFTVETQWYSNPLREPSLPKVSCDRCRGDLHLVPESSATQPPASIRTRLRSAVGHVTHSCEPWLHATSSGGVLHMRGLREQRPCSVPWTPWARSPELAQHECGPLQPNSGCFALIFIALNRMWPKAPRWSFCVLNIIFSQIRPRTALWGIFKMCNFLSLIAAAAQCKAASWPCLKFGVFNFNKLSTRGWHQQQVIENTFQGHAPYRSEE